MGKTRLEAFSDGVVAILITIMVLEFKTRLLHLRCLLIRKHFSERRVDAEVCG